jgi:hypothetical protein
MVRTNERATATPEFGHPVDLAFSNGLGILMRERRRMSRRDELTGRDLVPASADRSPFWHGGRGVRPVDAVKIGAR